MRILTNLKPIKRYILKYRQVLIIGFLLLFFGNLIQICEPIIINNGFNVLKEDYLQPLWLSKVFEFLDVNTKYDILIFFALLFFLVNLIRLPFTYFHQFLIMSASKKIECDLRNELFSYLQRLPLFYHRQQKTGDIMARFSDDIKCIDEFAGAGIAFGNYLVRAPVSIIYLFLISKELVFYISLPLIGISVSAYVFSRYVRKHIRIVQEHFGLLCVKVEENLSGVRVVKSYGNEGNEIDNYRKLSAEFLKRNMSYRKIWGMGRSTVWFLISLSQLIFLGIGCSLVISGKIDSGNFAAFFYQLNYLTGPIIILGISINLFQQALARMERINEMLLPKSDIEDYKKINENIAELKGEIEIKNLNFSLWKDKVILRDINIRFERGKSIGIIGNIGSGKSTLVNLIAGLYRGPEQSIFFDHHPIERIPAKVLSSSIGYVPQEAFLFSGSIRENICFGAPGADQQTLDRVSLIADIKKDIDELPQKYETLVGERGVTLSGGQKQRIAIARAVIIQPKILLFDNALSQVDAETENNILKNLTVEMKDCTTIFITNRITSIKNADLIVVLVNGQIVETGTHDELLQMRGFYSTFFEREAMEAALGTA